MQRALFLDRDGVINVDHGYVFRREDFEWVDGIFDAARAATLAGFALVVVSNQSGIARGIYTEADFLALTDWMCAEFAKEGAPVSRVYHCPFYEGATVAAYRDDKLGWRKPKPGMLLQAKADLGLDMAGSLMIGDHWSDASAAWAAGVERAAIIGKPKDRAPANSEKALRFATVRDAADWLASALPAISPKA